MPEGDEDAACLLLKTKYNNFYIEIIYMTTNRYKKDASAYIRFMGLERWINQCVACGRQGYKPHMPNHIFPWKSLHAFRIKEYYSPMQVYEYGLCNQCIAAIKAYE